MDNELLYCGIEYWTPCSYSSLYLSIFLSFMAKFVSQFSLEMCKLESSNMAYICRMSDCIVGLRLRVMALIFLFFIHFSFRVFSGTIIARMLKLGIHMDNDLMTCCIMGLRIRLLAFILPFICPFFCLLWLNLCHSFLLNCAS